MSDSEQEVISWDNITADNEEDPIKQILEKEKEKRATKRGRGRPPKTPPPPITPPPEPTEEEILSAQVQQMPAMDLAEMFSKSKSRSKSPKKSILRFSDDKEPEQQPKKQADPERNTLLKMYKQYFKAPLAAKHKRAERVWSDKHENIDIEREIRELENLCSEDDPSTILSNLWAASMGAFEAVGEPVFGLQTDGLGQVSATVSQRDEFRANMRELLLKYPYLRVMVGLGGYPELKLLLITATVVKEVHAANEQAARIRMFGPRPDKPVPEDLKKAFEGLGSQQ